jgi:HAD superfamily phosphoserine phosphatase-like hydrolase
MEEPKIFISSTYEDLHEIKDELQNFIVDTYDHKPVSINENDNTYEPHKSLEEYCYNSIKECFIFILLIKSKFGISANTDKINGIPFSQEIKYMTQLKYSIANWFRIPIFVFIYKNSLDEYNLWKEQKFSSDYNFNCLENINHAIFLKDIFKNKKNIHLYNFLTINDITNILKKQSELLFKKYLKNFQDNINSKNKEIYINPFKFFYFRQKHEFSMQELSNNTGIPKNKILSIENAGLKKSGVKSIDDFKKVKVSDAEILSKELNCGVEDIKAELPNDFLTQYLYYYMRYKKDNNYMFKPKAIVFDFDGTLTFSKEGYTTWEEIWVCLGYEAEECQNLHKQFSKKEITHEKWCKITEDKFKSRNLSKSILNFIAEKIILLPNVYEVLKKLSDKGIYLYICSGSIDYIIEKVLGDRLFHLFDGIKANKFKFSSDKLIKIIGTEFDFRGKADFLTQVASVNNINPCEILFIGNSQNDEWAYKSGAITLCINPRLTNPNLPHWAHSIQKVTDFVAILKFLNFEDEIENIDDTIQEEALEKETIIISPIPNPHT